VVGADRYRNPDEDLPEDFAERRETYAELQQPLDTDQVVGTRKSNRICWMSSRRMHASSSREIDGQIAPVRVSCPAAGQAVCSRLLGLRSTRLAATGLSCGRHSIGVHGPKAFNYQARAPRARLRLRRDTASLIGLTRPGDMQVYVSPAVLLTRGCTRCSDGAAQVAEQRADCWSEDYQPGNCQNCN